ncbi:hypothetical protein ACVWWQ_003373 [Rhodanobacter sp. TND4EL1]
MGRRSTVRAERGGVAGGVSCRPQRFVHGCPSTPAFALRSGRRALRLRPSACAQDERAFRLRPSACAQDERALRLRPSAYAQDERAFRLRPSACAQDERALRLRPSACAQDERVLRLRPSACARDERVLRLRPSACARDERAFRLRPSAYAQDERALRLRPSAQALRANGLHASTWAPLAQRQSGRIGNGSAEGRIASDARSVTATSCRGQRSGSLPDPSRMPPTCARRGRRYRGCT